MRFPTLARPGTAGRRQFRVRRHVWAGPETAQIVTGVATDSYRPCRQCSGYTAADFRTVTVYRITDRTLPWWLTAEAHWCEGEHGQMRIRGTRHAVLAASPRFRRRGGKREPVRNRRQDPLWVLDMVGGGAWWVRWSRITAMEIDSGMDCHTCGRLYGCWVFTLHDGFAPPAWLRDLNYHWCGGCRTGRFNTDLYASPVEPVAAPAGGR